MAAYFTLLVGFISTWGYWAVAVGMALESACLPIPSEIVLPFAGYLVSQGRLTFVEAVSAGLIGSMVGSILAYVVGMLGGRPLILKYGRYLFIDEKNLSRADQWVEKYGERAAFWARFFPIVRTFISLPLGITKMSFVRFLVYSFLGIIPWTVALTYAGKKLGENWTIIRALGDWVNIGILLLILLIFIGVKLRKPRQS